MKNQENEIVNKTIEFVKDALYNPDIPPQKYQNKEDYINSNAPTVNHFYEKLFLLKDRMKTETGKKLAEQRHRFMEEYLEQFFGEWEGLR